MIPAEEIRQGDLLRILPGETIPVDGTIINGETSVDQSIMTGESLPVDKGVGKKCFAVPSTALVRLIFRQQKWEKTVLCKQ